MIERIVSGKKKCRWVRGKTKKKLTSLEIFRDQYLLYSVQHKLRLPLSWFLKEHCKKLEAYQTTKNYSLNTFS